MEWNIIQLEEIDSTNTEVRRQSLQQAAEALVVTAEKQTAGKKRMRQVGNVEIPQKAFMSVLKLDEN